MADMLPFGTIKMVFCVICDAEVLQVLGGDDEWYCSHCEATYFEYIRDYYKEA